MARQVSPVSLSLRGSATVPVASSGVPPDESVSEDASGEDAERSGRDARAPPIPKTGFFETDRLFQATSSISLKCS